MKSAALAVRRAARGALAAIPVAAAGMSWHALAALLLAVLIVVAAVCWAIADNGRARRLTALIRAWRGTATRPATRARPAIAAGRQNSQRTG